MGRSERAKSVVNKQVMYCGRVSAIDRFLSWHNIRRDINTVYITDYSRIVGRKGGVLYLVGDYWELKDIDRIKEYALTHDITIEDNPNER